jgi:membrane associated rhomboid family serine protease
VSELMVAVCTALFAVLAMLDILGVMPWQRSLAVLGLSCEGIYARHWFFQFVSAPLLHADILHLGFNMLALWMLGPDVERVLGIRRYVILSVLCAMSASIGFLLLNWQPGMVTLGYSAVIFGLLVAQACLFPDRTIYVYALFPVKMKYAAILLGAVELYLSFRPMQQGVGHELHVMGAVAAWVYLRIFLARIPALPQVWLARPPRRAPEGSLDPPRVAVRPSPAAPGGAIISDVQRPSPPRERRQPARPGEPLRLLVLKGSLSGQRFLVADAPVTMGRAAENTLCLAGDTAASRMHARIARDESGYCVIEDVGSRNGVFVNGRRTSRAVLQPADRIRVGNTELMVVAQTSAV